MTQGKQYFGGALPQATASCSSAALSARIERPPELRRPAGQRRALRRPCGWQRDEPTQRKQNAEQQCGNAGLGAGQGRGAG